MFVICNLNTCKHIYMRKTVLPTATVALRHVLFRKLRNSSMLGWSEVEEVDVTAW